MTETTTTPSELDDQRKWERVGELRALTGMVQGMETTATAVRDSAGEMEVHAFKALGFAVLALIEARRKLEETINWEEEAIDWERRGVPAPAHFNPRR